MLGGELWNNRSWPFASRSRVLAVEFGARVSCQRRDFMIGSHKSTYLLRDCGAGPEALLSRKYWGGPWLYAAEEAGGHV